MESSRLVSISTIKESLEFKYMKDEYLTWSGGLHRILCMQGGDDDSSYAKNSQGPALAITLSKPLLVSSIQLMKLFVGEESLRIADLGCATGHNTLATIDLMVDTLRERYYEECGGFEPEFEAYFSDLPSNDFNFLFRSLPPFSMANDNKRRYYAAGVPGSFYHRLFPKGKLHVAVSLSALHWISRIPEVVLDKRSPAWNKGRAWIDGAKKEVVEAFANQSEEDLKAFLQCRKEEIVEGGMLFLLMAGRPSSLQPETQLGDPDSRAKHPFTSSMDQAWEDLVNEGLVDEETRDSFNIPAYMRSMDEVEKVFHMCGGFEIQRMEYQRIIEHTKEKQEESIRDPVSYGKAKANLVRATLKPILEAHIGPNLTEELFKRYEKRASGDLGMLHKVCFYGVIIVSAIRK